MLEWGKLLSVHSQYQENTPVTLYNLHNKTVVKHLCVINKKVVINTQLRLRTDVLQLLVIVK